MHPVKIRAKKRRTVLAFVLALGLGLPSPAQAYLLDFTVASINPGVLIPYAGSYSSGSPPVESNKVIDLSRTDYPTGQVNQGDISSFDPGFAASCASGPGAFVSTRGLSGDILNRIAPFSSTLLLLGGGLIGLVGLRSRRRRG